MRSPQYAPLPWFPDGQTWRLILASASPRRSAILRQVGLDFVQVASNADETWPVGTSPRETVRILAERKARAAVPRDDNAVVLAADTAVFLGEEPLGKPASVAEAAGMLTRLAGRQHEVITGIALIDTLTGQEIADSVCTEVRMRDCDDREIAAYAQSGEPFDKAGGYGIQGMAAGFVTGINGCYFNVVGLPITRVLEILKTLAEQRRT